MIYYLTVFKICNSWFNKSFHVLKVCYILPHCIVLIRFILITIITSIIIIHIIIFIVNVILYINDHDHHLHSIPTLSSYHLSQNLPQIHDFTLDSFSTLLQPQSLSQHYIRLSDLIILVHTIPKSPLLKLEPRYTPCCSSKS